jgi:hypothetical protein
MLRAAAGGGGSVSYDFPDNDIAAVFSDTTNWQWASGRGYYCSVADLNHTTDLIIPGSITLGNVSEVRCVVTGYYNNPSSSLGVSVLRVTLSDETTIQMGTRDAWAGSSDGQTIYKGDAGTLSKQKIIVIEQEFVASIPVGKTVSSIALNSGYLSGHPASVRGIRSIKLR